MADRSSAGDRVSTAAWIACIALAVFNLAGSVDRRRSAKRAKAAAAKSEASWAEACHYAEVANLQAHVLAECSELLCEDCRTIAHGNYMAKAYGAASALIAEDEARGPDAT